MASVYHIEREKQFLSAAIAHPEILADCPQIRDRTFSPTNRMVFAALKAVVASSTDYSPFVLIDYLNSIGVKVGDTIEPALYVNALLGMSVNERAGIGMAKLLKQTEVRREINEIGRQIMELTSAEVPKGESEPLKAGEMLRRATEVFNRHLNLIEGSKEHEPVDLYGTIRSFLERENDISAKAIASPWPLLNDLWGYMDVGSVWLIAARLKTGKSSIWLSMGQQLAAADVDDNLRILVLDTELEPWENQSRSLAAISGVSEFRIRQGWYKKRPEEKRKVDAAAEELEPLTQRVHHCFCGNMELDQILSVARRWAAKNLTEGKRGLIVYDYVKLSSQAEFGGKTPLFITIGGKMDAFKNLSKELHVPILTFAQTNRENVDTKAGERMQNSAVIGGSDMLAQFASVVLLLEELSPEEKEALNQLGPDDATHSLREIACRQRGPCELGEDRLVPVKVEDGKGKVKTRYVKNYLLYRFASFHVTEVGSYRKILERNASLGVKVQPPPESRGPML